MSYLNQFSAVQWSPTLWTKGYFSSRDVNRCALWNWGEKRRGQVVYPRLGSEEGGKKSFARELKVQLSELESGSPVGIHPLGRRTFNLGAAAPNVSFAPGARKKKRGKSAVHSRHCLNIHSPRRNASSGCFLLRTSQQQTPHSLIPSVCAI